MILLPIRMVLLAATTLFFTAGTSGVAAGPGAPAMVSGATAPCSLLTPDEIKTVLGSPVQPGVPSTADGTSSCTWKDAKGMDRVYLSLKDASDWKAFRDSMQATGKMIPVTGLAEDAFFVGSSGTSAALYTLKRGHVLLLTVDGPGSSRADNEASEKSLAPRILQKL